MHRTPPSTPSVSVLRRLSFSLLLLPLVPAWQGCSDHGVRIEELLARAREDVARRRYKPALTAIDAALQLDEDHVEARILKAEIAYNQEDLDGAESLLAALQLSGQGDHRIGLGLALVRKDQGDFKTALEQLETVPATYRPPATWAEILSGAGQQDEAARIVCEALAANPWDDSLPFLLSRIQAKRGKTDSAKIWADHHQAITRRREAAGRARGLEYQGADLQAAVLRASTLFEAGHWLPAIELVKGILNSPEPPRPALIVLGRMLIKMGDGKAAQIVLQRARTGEEDPEVAPLLEAAKKLGDKPPTSMLAEARKQARQGDAFAARALILLAAEDQPAHDAGKAEVIKALREVLKTFTRPADVFLRVWAIRRLRTMAPEDPTLAPALAAAGRELGVEFR